MVLLPAGLVLGKAILNAVNNRLEEDEISMMLIIQW